MEVTLIFSFCSHGQFVRSEDEQVQWFERTDWENQFGSGKDYCLNLIWFRVSLEIYRKHSESPEDSDERVL